MHLERIIENAPCSVMKVDRLDRGLCGYFLRKKASSEEDATQSRIILSPDSKELEFTPIPQNQAERDALVRQWNYLSDKLLNKTNALILSCYITPSEEDEEEWITASSDDEYAKSLSWGISKDVATILCDYQMNPFCQVFHREQVNNNGGINIPHFHYVFAGHPDDATMKLICQDMLG